MAVEVKVIDQGQRYFYPQRIYSLWVCIQSFRAIRAVVCEKPWTQKEEEGEEEEEEEEEEE